MFESESSLPPSSTGTESPASTDYSSSEPLPPRPKKKRPQPKKKVLKNPVHITFPLKGLDMTSYLRTSSPQEELYDLFGVVEHVGRQMDGGHYVAYIRGKDSHGADCWWKCNDGKCWIVTDEMVSSAQAYIWFYERRAERGQVPEDWGGVVDEGPAASRVVFATPESEERPVGMEEMGRKRDGSWEGRLRGSTSS
jgi:Ubiquitin carboxyl-terminal hydrolase